MVQAKNILIVEDDEWLAEQYGRILESVGYDIIIAPHALAAIQVIDDYPINLIILDVLLTGTTAFALLHELQSYGDTGEIPVILCTNLAKDLSGNDLHTYGVKKILDKTTMQPDDLIVEVKRLMT